MKKITIIILLSITYITVSAQLNSFKKGDIIFQDLDCGPLCDAIEAVTDGYKGMDFSHVGIIDRDKEDTKFYVIEAIGSKVKRTLLDTFLVRSLNAEGKPKVIIGRLNESNEQYIKMALDHANLLIGVPYDDRFILDNDSLYCSELIYEIFKKSAGEELFYLQAMTYKDPVTKTFYPAWVDYYKNLNSSIPEGLPGINPGLLSRSDKLIIYYVNGDFILDR